MDLVIDGPSRPKTDRLDRPGGPRMGRPDGPRPAWHA